MAPGSNERHPPPPSHTGTIPKTKIRNCVVPQEAVTPTRRDINSSSLVSTSLDWVPVPVSEYNSRSGYSQSSRTTTNNAVTVEHDFSHLDNSISLESALQRFVSVRPQPRGLPLPMQPPSEHSDDSLHLYHHPNANGVSPHGSHGAAAVMIVNPTTPNTLTGNTSQPYNVPANANRNNLTRTFHSTRNVSEAEAAAGGACNNVHTAGGRTNPKTNNINSNLCQPAQSALSHRPETTHMNGVGDTESLGEAMVAACPDPASVERRLGQIREYIRVTSCLVDTMRNSEDEAYIEHTKEEYDELVETVMKLKESENKLMNLLNGMEPENNEVLTDTEEVILENEKPKSTNPFVDNSQAEPEEGECNESVSTPDGSSQTNITAPESNIKPDDKPQALLSDNKIKLNTEITLTFVKKVTNIENEQLNKSNFTESLTLDLVPPATSEQGAGEDAHSLVALSDRHEVSTNEPTDEGGNIDSDEVVTAGIEETSVVKTDEELNELLRMNIISCNEKLATMEVLKEAKNNEEGCERGAERTVKFCKLLDLLALGGAPDLATNMSPHPHTNYHEPAPPVRPVSAQSNGSGYSDNELWQNELKAKMEVSQQRLAALQDQQKRLLQYQAEAKQQLAIHTLNRSRQAAESATRHTPPPADHLHHMHNTHSQHNQLFASNQQSVRMYNSNQIGVATTLPHTTNTANHHIPGQFNVSSGCLQENYRAGSSSGHAEPASPGRGRPHHRDDHFTMLNTNLLPQAERERSRGSEEEEEEGQESMMSPHGLQLQHKLRDLQRKKQHMENLVSVLRPLDTVAEFQNLQAAEHLLEGNGPGGGGGGGDEATEAGETTARRNTYSSDESEGEELSPPRKCNKSDANIKNEDPFKLMEISAIKAALQKTKDLMRTVERYEPQEPLLHEHNFQHSSHSNINDNKSDGCGSAGEWSTEGSVCRSIRNTIQPAGKLTNHTNHTQPHHSGGGGGGSGAHEASISSLQLLAQQLKQEAENISMERQRLKHSLSRNKEGGSKLSQKKVNAEMCGSSAGTETSRSSPGPLERKQAALRAKLAEKQRQLQMILNKEKELPSSSEVQNMKADCSYSALNHSYNSEQEEGNSQVDEVLFPAHPHTQTDHHHYRSEEGSVYGESSLSALPLHMQTTANYCSDSDTGSRDAGVQRPGRSRRNRATPPERQPPHQHARTAQTAGVISVGSRSGSALAEPRADLPHTLHPQPGESSSSTPSYPAQLTQPPPAWNNKSNQDARSNQFTQNSYSQTMERLLGSQQMPFPPSVPFNMMMPYGMVSGTACGCSWWGPWCWQQITEQQREIHRLREQLNNLEERWRAETAPHALNNQVPPGNRANNYWDNFRSYSRQNLLSANSKTNADGHLGSVPPHNPHPLVERSHNALHPAPALPAPAPAPTPPAKRNSNGGARRHNMSYETQHSLPSAPDVLNVNQHVDTEIAHANINRDTSLPERNLNFTEAIPEIIQAHSSNLNRSPDSVNTKNKSSSKLPAKNSANRRNYSLDFVQNSNINIASTSEAPNPNLASTSRDHSQDKATSKLFDLLRENVYSEVTALISANELHPDFLIQLFRDLQRVSSDSMRQHTLQSIRDLLSQCAGADGVTASADTVPDEVTPAERSQNAVEDVSSTNSHHPATVRDGASIVYRDIVDFMIARGEDICSPDVLEAFKVFIIESHREAGQSIRYSQKRLQELLSKYEGMRLRDVSGDIIEDLITVQSAGEHEESGRPQSDASESSVLQDVAGALDLFGSSDSHLHQLNSNAYEAWGSASSTNAEREHEGRFAQKGKVDLIECVEMYNGDLAEADQTCPGEAEPAAGDAADLLPDVVETEEATPTEAEAEWLGLDRVPTRLHMEDSPANQKD